MNDCKRSLVPVMAGLLLSGCSMLKTPEVQIDPQLELRSSHNGLESATIVYKLARGPAIRPSGRAGDLQTLSIIYPHPQQGRGHALAEVVVIRSGHGGGPGDRPAKYGQWDPRGWVGRFGDAARRTMPGVALGKGIKEAKALDISKHELDGIFTQLERTGFFWETSGTSLPVSTTPGATVDLTAVVNGARFEQAWSRVDALDELLRTIRQKGRLITYRRSAAKSSDSSPSSTQPPEHLYRQLTQRRGNRKAPCFDGPPQMPAARISRLPPIGHSN
jgi:hypothetical protein